MSCANFILLIAFVGFAFRGVASVDPETFVTGDLATAACSQVERYSTSGSITNLERDHVDPFNPATRGYFKRNECYDSSCSVQFQFTESARAGGRIPIFGPQSQVNFSVTTTGVFGDKLYVYVSEPHLAWPLALAACISNGMQLVDIEDNTEMGELAKIIWEHDERQKDIRVWTGGHRFTEAQNTRTMHWYAGNKPIPINDMWNTGRPSYDQDKNEHCVSIDNRKTRGGFKLQDTNCRAVLPFMCESML